MSPTLEELILLRRQEREDEQLRHTRAVAGQVELALGPRVAEALAGSPWEVSHAVAERRFPHRGGGYRLGLRAVLGVDRVELELRHEDGRFAPLARKAGLGDLSEDWFLNALDTLATQVAERLVNPKNWA